MQLVYEFGSEKPDAVLEAFSRAIGTAEYAAYCEFPDRPYVFLPTDDTLASAGAKLERGEIVSFSLNPSSGLIRYTLAFCPLYQEVSVSLYHGTIEYTGDDYLPIWELLLAIPGLRYACLGSEEGVELEDRHLSVETFPWDEWPLAIGALRKDETAVGSWYVREGPEMHWLRKSRRTDSGSKSG